MQHIKNTEQNLNEKDQEKDIMSEKKYTKWKKIAIISIIIFIITGIIILVYFTIRNKDSSIEEKNFTEYITCDPPDENVSVIDIGFKYSGFFNKKNTFLLSNGVLPLNNSNTRRLISLDYYENQSFSFVVYFHEKINDLYYCYILIEKFDIQKDDIIETYDFTEEDSYKSNIPIIKFTVSSNGEIIEKFYNKNSAHSFLELLDDFLNDMNTQFQMFKNNKTKIFSENKTETNSGSNLYLNINGELTENGTIKNLNKTKLYNFKNNEVNDVIPTNESSPIQPDNFNYNDNVLKGIIKEHQIDSNLSINLISDELDEDIKYKIGNLLKNINFSKQKNDKKNENFNMKKEEDNKLRNLEIASFFTPVQHSYSLFKVHLSSGDIIGLGASIGFFPLNSTIVIQLIYKQNDESKVIFELYDNNNNFKEIAEKLRNLYIDVAITIGKNSDNLNNNLESFKKEIINNLKIIINNIKDIKGIRETFKIGLEDLYEISKNKIMEGFNNSILEIDSTYTFIDDLEKECIDDNNNEIKLINSNSSKIINDSLESEKNNLNEIYNLTNIFYNDIMEEIKNKNESNIEIILDIETFYSIREQLDDIEYIFIEFEKNFKYYIDNTTYYYQNYINKEFNNLIEDNLSKDELIEQEVRINPIIIDNYSEDIKNNFIHKVKLFRVKIENIFKTILNSISNALNNYELKGLYDEYISQNYFIDFKNKKDKIISELERIIKVDTNFTLFINDLKVLYEIEREIQEQRVRTFNSIFVEAIDKLNFDYLTEEVLNDFTEKMENITQFILNDNVLIQDFAKTNLLRDARDIIDNFLGNVIQKIKDKYNNKTFINNTLEPFYDGLNEINKKYRELFYEQHFKKNLEFYISPPFEIPFKLNLITNKKFSQTNVIKRQIENLVQKYISYIYYEKYPIIEEIVNNQYNLIMEKMPESVLVNKDVFETYKKEVIEKFNMSNKLSNYDITLKPSELKHINSTVYYYESNISAYVSQVNGEVDIYMDQIFCLKRPPSLCYKKTITDKSIIYNYQIAKIRSYISDFVSLLKYSEYIINDTNLNTFYIDEFYNEFIENIDFHTNDVSLEIISYLKNINKEEQILLEPYLSSIKQILKDTFNSNLNIDKIISTFEIIINNIFNIPNSFILERSNDIWKAENEIVRIFVNKTEEYMNYEKNYGFFFNESEFIKVYDNFFNKIKEMYDNIYDEISNSLKLNNEILNYLIDYEGNIIDNAYNTIKDYLKEIADISPKIELLNNTFSVSDIDTSEIDDLYNQIKLNYSTQFKSISLNQYNSTIINDILYLLNDSQKILLERLQDQKVILVTYLTTHTQKIKSNNNIFLINSMSDYEDSLIKTFEDFYNNFKILFSDNNIKNLLLENAKNNINELNINVSFDDFKNNITKILGSLLDSASMIYNTERKEFSETIYNYLEKSFKEGIQIYIESYGFNYYDAVVDQDFYNKIYPDLSYIHGEINDTKEYSTILFNSSLFQNVSEYIKETLSNIFIQSKEIIKNNTENRVEFFINRKLDMITETLKDLIIDYFNKNITNYLKSKEFTNEINGKIYDLLPIEFSSAFKQKLNKFYMNLSNETILMNIKKNFTELLNKELELIYEHLDTTQTDINNILNNYNIFKIDESMINILNIYNRYSDDIENNKLLKIDENNDKNIKDNIRFLMTLISEKLYKCSEIYFIKFEELKVIITEQIERNLDFKNDFIKNLDSDNRIENTRDLYENLLLIMKDIKTYSLNLFSNFSNEMNNVSEEEREIKRKNEENKGMRRLNEYKIYYIDGFLKELEEVYNDYGIKISNVKEYIDLSSEYNNFRTKMIDEINGLTSYINSTYIYLKHIYDGNKLNEYFSNIEDQAEEIKILAYQFLRNQSFIIDKTIQLLRKDTLELYPNVKNELKHNIEIILNNLIPLKMEDFKELERSDTSKYNITLNSENNIGNYFINSGSKGNIEGNYITNYSINYDMNEGLIIFNAILNSTAKGNINSQIDFINEEFKGVLGDGEIGLNVNYSLYDEKSYIEAYAKQNTINYNSSFMNNNSSESNIYSYIQVNPNVHIKFKKDF